MQNHMTMYIGYIGTCLGTLFSIVIFFRYRIWEVILFLSGYSAKKEMKALKKKNQLQNGTFSHQKKHNKKVKKTKTTKLFLSEGDTKTEQLIENALLEKNEEQTILLQKENREPDFATSEQTTILEQDNCEIYEYANKAQDFVIYKDIICIHTDESIEEELY